MNSQEHKLYLAKLFGDNYREEDDQLTYEFGIRPANSKVFGILNYDVTAENALDIQALHLTCACWTHGEVVGGKQIIVELDLGQVGASKEYANSEGLFEVWRAFRIDFEDGLDDFVIVEGPKKIWNSEKIALHATLHGFVKFD